MPPKKSQINPFSMYMREQEPILSRRGIHFNSKQELVAYLFPHFNQLSQFDRQKYINLAKLEKETLKADLTRKYDDRGVPLAFIEAERKEQRDRVLTMRSEIADLVENRDGGESLLNVKFYTMFSTLHCQTDEGSNSVYIPCEMSLSEWTLADGLLRTCSFVVNTDEIPCGYKSRCLDISDATHRLPLDFECGESNYPALWIRLKEFINPQKSLPRYPPVFTRESEMVSLEKCLQWIHSRALDSCISPFRIYSLSVLLYELLAAAGEPQLESFCSDQLDMGTYDFINELACAHHADDDNSKHCARAMSQRQAFIVLDLVASKFGIELVGGRHVPVNKQSTNVNVVTPIATPSIQPPLFKPARNTEPNLPRQYNFIEPTGGHSRFAGIGWDMDEGVSRVNLSDKPKQPARMSLSSSGRSAWGVPGLGREKRQGSGQVGSVHGGGSRISFGRGRQMGRGAG